MASCDAKGGLLLGTERTSHWFLPLGQTFFTSAFLLASECLWRCGAGMPIYLARNSSCVKPRPPIATGTHPAFGYRRKRPAVEPVFSLGATFLWANPWFFWGSEPKRGPVEEAAAPTLLTTKRQSEKDTAS